MPEGKLINKKILPILILMIIIAITWIGWDIYKALNKGIEPTVLEEQARPLNPLIDQGVFDRLAKRLTLEDEDFVKIPPIRKIKFEVQSSSTASAEKSLR